MLGMGLESKTVTFSQGVQMGWDSEIASLSLDMKSGSFVWEGLLVWICDPFQSFGSPYTR